MKPALARGGPPRDQSAGVLVGTPFLGLSMTSDAGRIGHPFRIDAVAAPYRLPTSTRCGGKANGRGEHSLRCGSRPLPPAGSPPHLGGRLGHTRPGGGSAHPSGPAAVQPVAAGQIVLPPPGPATLTLPRLKVSPPTFPADPVPADPHPADGVSGRMACREDERPRGAIGACGRLSWRGGRPHRVDLRRAARPMSDGPLPVLPRRVPEASGAMVTMLPGHAPLPCGISADERCNEVLRPRSPGRAAARVLCLGPGLPPAVRGAAAIRQHTDWTGPHRAERASSDRNRSRAAGTGWRGQSPGSR